MIEIKLSLNELRSLTLECLELIQEIGPNEGSIEGLKRLIKLWKSIFATLIKKGL